MTKKLISFIAVLCILFTSFGSGSAGIGTIEVHAADVDVDEAEEVYDGASVDEDSELLLPVGGVSEDFGIEIEWNDEWDSLGENTQKRGTKGNDPDGAYTKKTDGSGTYGYDNLSALQKEIYDSLKTAVNDFIISDAYKSDLNEDSAGITAATKLTGDTVCTESDQDKARVAFRYDNPQYFFLDSSYSHAINTTENKSVLILYVDDYYYTFKNRKEAQEAIEETGSEWIDAIKVIMQADQENGEYLAAVYAHNLIIDEIDYAYIENTSTPQDKRWAHSMAGVFTGQGVVCEGYAKAYQYLLNMCGIDNIYIVGRAGTSGGRDSGGHAWNCIYIDKSWYPVDLTWDDLGDGNMWYSYFAIPGNDFNNDHKADNMGYPGMYDIPDFSSSDNYSYYKYFGGYGNGSVRDAESAQQLINNASVAKPDFTDYLYFSLNDTEEVQYMAQALKTSIRNWSSKYFGRTFRIEYIKCNNPATEISLSDEKVTVAVDGSVNITAEIAEDSDDKIAFNLDSTKYCSIKVSGNTIIVKGKKNGKAKLTARTVGGKATATCEITVGTGIPDPEDVNVWQNGGKNYKTLKLETSLTATSWKDSKGKTKPGKLVWIASDEDITIEFDREKHKVTTKTKPTKGSVSNKGIVTAKTAGKLYVYCCDTGSFDVEKFVVEVLASPSKLYLANKASLMDTKEALKKIVLNVGSTGKVYICPFVKDGTADEANEYTVSLAKSEQSSYVSLSKVKSDGKGGIYFNISALDFDRSKKKAASVKIIVECKQSGKKTSLTAVICNPVQSISVTDVSENNILAKKKNIVSMKLIPGTYIKDLAITTDKLKIYVGNTSVTLDSEGKKVTADKGATVKAKFDAKTMKLTLTAGQDAGETAVVYLAATNPQTKKTLLHSILKVGTDGTVTFTSK